MRNYGRFTTTIYRDDDFRKLTTTQQALYFMLGLQAEVTAAGTLPLTYKRWAAMADDLTPEGVADELANLEQHGHVLIDGDTEELLIVKFVKWDGGIGNEKRRPVIRESALAIASERIRHRVAHEIAKLGYADMASELSGNAIPDAQSRFDRVVVTKGDVVPNPFSATPEGEPSAENGGPPSMFCAKHPNGTEEPCGPCGTAKARYKHHLEQTAEKEAEAKRARAAAVADCPHCDEHGKVLDPETGRPLRRCDHRRSA